MTFLTKDVQDERLPKDDILTIEDGNDLFYYLKDIPESFKQICAKLFKQASVNSDVIFSADMYNANSVKGLERKWRVSTEKVIVKGVNTRKPRDWKNFLCNDENKEQLISLMHTCWLELVKGDQTLIFIENGQWYDLAKNDESIPVIRSNQEETDSRVVLYCSYAATKGYKYVRIKSPDCDIFWIIQDRLI